MSVLVMEAKVRNGLLENQADRSSLYLPIFTMVAIKYLLFVQGDGHVQWTFRCFNGCKVNVSLWFLYSSINGPFTDLLMTRVKATSLFLIL